MTDKIESKEDQTEPSYLDQLNLKRLPYMIGSNTSPRTMVKFLNTLLDIDPAAVSKVFLTRYKTNESMVQHPTVQISDRAEIYGEAPKEKSDVFLSAIGILNGFYGTIDNPNSKYHGYGPLQMQAVNRLIGDDKPNPRILAFYYYDPTKDTYINDEED